tara:strand:- start:3565 stop:4908 length:1344 start_codon:yes stop_codon:yes gene_type:complete
MLKSPGIRVWRRLRFTLYPGNLPGSQGSAEWSMGETVAVVGSGMAGLAAAHGCRKAGFDVTLFEARPGHGMDAHAMAVQGGNVDLPLRVMSPRNWHSVLALAAEVGVGTFPVATYASCSWTDRQTWFRSGRMPVTGWPWVGSWRYLNRRSLRLARGLWQLRRASAGLAAADASFTLADFLQQQSFDPLFWRGLVLPLLTTICTCDEAQLLAWPAPQLLSLLDEILHGGGLVRLQGGTSALVAALAAAIPAYTGSPVQRLAAREEGIMVHNARGEGGQFDRVILAVQANQLDFLEGEQFQRERQVLDQVRFDSGELWLHRDPRFLPRRTADWSALNFQTDPELARVMFTVLVNAVEPTLASAEPVLQTWNPLYEPDPETVLARVPLQRAVVHTGTAGIHRALAGWHAEPDRRVFYSGSWAYPGVPLLESAVRSAQAVVARVQQLQARV